MSLYEFYSTVLLSAGRYGWRIGQALFNELSNVWPELAEKLRGSASDPFYAESPLAPRFDAAIKRIESEWFTPANPTFRPGTRLPYIKEKR